MYYFGLIIPALTKAIRLLLLRSSDLPATSAGDLPIPGDPYEGGSGPGSQPPALPVIYYATRTHSQIAQVVRELKRSGYKVRRCSSCRDNDHIRCLSARGLIACFADIAARLCLTCYLHLRWPLAPFLNRTPTCDRHLNTFPSSRTRAAAHGGAGLPPALLHQQVGHKERRH